MITVYKQTETYTSYVVHYYEENTTNRVAEDKIVENQTYEAEVTEHAIAIDGLYVVGPTEDTIVIQEEGNEFVFYYAEKNITLNAIGGSTTYNGEDKIC